MITVRHFYQSLVNNGINFISGVPDSLLKDFCAFVSDESEVDCDHVIAANEGAAVGLAVGHHLGSKGLPLVYLQNSGLGNVVNPVLSIADDDVYGIPLVLLIGWRGQPDKPDEPQHIKQGRVTESMLVAMEIPYVILSRELESNEIEMLVDDICHKARSESKPVAILVGKGTFNGSMLNASAEGSISDLTRENAIGVILNHFQDSIFVSTTGMASREVFEIREKLGFTHERDFLTVGAMGHTSQIALGLAIGAPNTHVVCIDGDGSVIMHMGSLAITGTSSKKGLIHVVLNNGAHDSVGGQPTVGHSIDLCAIALASGYRGAAVASNHKELNDTLVNLGKIAGPYFLEIKVKKGARNDLGRPTISPKENKKEFMDHLCR